MLSQCENQKFLAWPYLVVAPQMRCHICCVAGIFEFSVAYSTNNWMVIILFEAKMHPNLRFVLRRGRRNLGSIIYAVHFVVFRRVPDATWDKAFKALQKLTRDQNDVVFSGGRLERDKWEVGNIFAARESIVRIDSATDDTIRVSLTVAIRFTDASVNRYTPSEWMSNLITILITDVITYPCQQGGSILYFKELGLEKANLCCRLARWSHCRAAQTLSWAKGE